MNIEILRNTLYKAYLDDFARFCDTLGGATAEIMGDLLAFEVRTSEWLYMVPDSCNYAPRIQGCQLREPAAGRRHAALMHDLTSCLCPAA